VSSAAQRSKRMRRVVSNIKNARKIEDRRDLLVAAAIKVFLKKGFHAATVREIGSAAGMTQGTIYNYVRSKDDILFLVCDKVVTAYQAAIREVVDRLDDSSVLLESTIRAIVQVCVPNVWPAPGLQVDFASWRVQSAAMYPAREHPLRP
jgi:AcrR family transcriptional regulator